MQKLKTCGLCGQISFVSPGNNLEIASDKVSLLKELEETLPSLYPYFLERQESEQKHFDATRKMINHHRTFPYSNQFVSTFIKRHETDERDTFFADTRDLVISCFSNEEENSPSVFSCLDRSNQISVYNMLLYQVYRLELGLDKIPQDEEEPLLKAVFQGEQELGLSREKPNEGISIYKGIATSYVYRRQNEWSVEAFLEERNKVFKKK